MLTRRRILAAAAAFVVSFRSGTTAPRTVYDLAVDAWASTPSWATCDNATVRRVGTLAVVEARCRTLRGVKVPRRGGTVSLDADVEYADTGADVGSCVAATRIKKAGTVTLSCEVALPQEPALPIVITGNGPGVSETFWLPGGALKFETTGTPAEGYRWIELNLSDGDEYGLWDTFDPPTVTRVETIYELAQGIIESNADGPWRVVISEAFPS